MKILNKFTLKNLKLNKSRTIVTGIGIMLSVALIMVVAGMASSAQQTMVEAQILASGDYELYVENADSKILDNANANRNVKSVYINRIQGTACMPKSTLGETTYINVTALSEKAYTDCFDFRLSEGRFPQNDSEIVLTKEMLENSLEKYKLGDTITLDVGRLVTDTPEEESCKFPLISRDLGGEFDVKVVDTNKKNYTVVGFFDEIYSSRFTSYYNNDFIPYFTAFTVLNEKADASASNLYIKLTAEGNKNYVETCKNILGLTDEQSQELKNDCFIELSENNSFSAADINITLMRYRGFALNDEIMGTLFSLALIIIGIIMLTSIFVIRNSFAISVTEKTKLYGMLASIGATSKQIRHNVLFEGFILGIISIPAGLLLGIGVIALLVVLLNALLADMLNGITFVYSIPWLVPVIAVVLSAVIILLSTLSSAIRASRLAPITAIRSNNDIKVNKKKRKSYKSPKFIKKLFGIGGDIAYKNLKRSKKKYRTTVISIIVTVALFITISSFIEYNFKFMNEYYTQIPYNVIISNEGTLSDDEYNKIFSDMRMREEVKSCDKVVSYNGAEINDIVKYYTPEAKKVNEDIDNTKVMFNIYSLENSKFKEYVEKLGFDYEEVKDKVLITNKLTYYDNDNVKHFGKYYDIPKNTTVPLYTRGSFTDEEIAEIKASDPDFVYNPDYYKPTDIVIYSTIDEEFDNYLPSYLTSASDYGDTLIVSEDTFNKLYGDEDTSDISKAIIIDSDNAQNTVEAFYHSDYESAIVSNLQASVDANNTIILVLAIFGYGFIIVISLIGVTNVFNTINTNMRLRSKEFAMLKSIGMTKKEFNRMIRLESLFYGLKSLIIGVPIGILGSFAVFNAVSGSIDFGYSFPTASVLISIVFVFFVIWLIMRASIRKVSKQNIIETIRNDNI